MATAVRDGQGAQLPLRRSCMSSSRWQSGRRRVAEREVDDLELEIKLREAQEKALKSTIRELEGEIHRLKMAFSSDGVDMEYLKNILVQLFKGGPGRVIPTAGRRKNSEPF